MRVPLAFRNLRVSPEDPVASWPTEAVQAALERGDLTDWRRLATEVRRDPWGATARRIEEVLGHTRPYGIAEVMDLVVAQARADAEGRERAAVAAQVRDAIDRSGLSRAAFASRIGTSASRLSTYATGRVTPSAAMLLRILRTADAVDRPSSG